MRSTELAPPGQKPISARWLCYIAGFVDGEGSVSWNRLKIGNTYPLTLFIAREFFGGQVYRENTRNGRTMFAWCVYGEESTAALTALVPFLIEKQLQALLVLKVGNYPPKSEQRRLLMSYITELKRIDHG
jgi:hypothetical protein